MDRNSFAKRKPLVQDLTFIYYGNLPKLKNDINVSDLGWSADQFSMLSP